MAKSDDIKGQIARLKTNLEEALKWEQELESGSPIAVATELHKTLCTWNHTDGCGWEYESWERPGQTRQEWLNKAHAFIALAAKEGVPLPKALGIFKWRG